MLRRLSWLGLALAVLTSPVEGQRSNVFLPGGATASELQMRYSSGAALTLFQGFVDVFCRTAARGGILDTYAAEYDGAEHVGVYPYAYLEYTYPVPNVNYRDCSSQAAIDAPLFGLLDEIIKDGAGGLGTYSPRLSAACFAYAAAFSRLGPTRRQQLVALMRLNADTYGTAINPLGHAEGPRGRTVYHSNGYCSADAGDGSEAVERSEALTRTGARGAYITGPTGNQAFLNLVAGTDGGYAGGHGYFMSEPMQSYGFVDFLYHDSYRLHQGDSTVWATGTNKVHEYFPQWMVHLLAPYKPVPSPTFSTYLLLKAPQSQDTTMDSAGNYPETAQFTGAYLANLARVYASSNPQMAALARWLCEETYYVKCQVPWSASSTLTKRWATWANLIGYNTVTGRSPSALGLQRNRCFTYGQCFFRDSWTYDGTSSLVTLYAAPWQWTAPYQYTQAPHGSFSVHYGGPIVIDPGAGAHSAAQESGWGGNTIIFPRPAETRSGRTRWDKGGARPLGNFPTANEIGDFTENSEWDLGGLKTAACGTKGANCARIDVSDDAAAHRYQYVYADLCRGYNGSQNIDDENSPKCVNFERQMANLQPAKPGADSGFVVIYDRVTTPDAGVEPRWLLWPAAHVTVTNKTMTISGATRCAPASEACTTRNGVETPHWTGTCDNRVTGTIAYRGNAGLSAKGYWTPLLPANCKIIERGGPNAANVAYQADSHEWEDPYGVHGATVESTNDSVGGPGVGHLAPWAGSYRYELLYQTTATNSPFLNVIEYATPASAAKQATGYITGMNTTGVHIDAAAGKRCVIFKTTSGTLTTGDFVVPASSTVDCLVADLAPSTAITFTKGSDIASVTHIATNDRDLTYTSTGQRTMWLRIVTGAGPNRTLSW